MLYAVKITKSAGGTSSAVRWSNVYHIRTPELITSPKMRQYIDDLVLMEKEIHLGDTFFLRALISTVAVEAAGDTSGRRGFNLSGTGQVGVGDSQPYNKEAVLAVGLDCEGGDPGKKYYRNCFTEAMIDTVAGVSSVRPGPMEPVNNSLGRYLVIADRPELVVLGANETDETAARVVNHMSVAGFGMRNTTRRKKKK